MLINDINFFILNTFSYLYYHNIYTIIFYICFMYCHITLHTYSLCSCSDGNLQHRNKYLSIIKNIYRLTDECTTQCDAQRVASCCLLPLQRMIVLLNQASIVASIDHTLTLRFILTCLTNNKYLCRFSYVRLSVVHFSAYSH